MSNYSSLKTTINANVKTNGNQEITGSVMNTVLNQIVTSFGAGYLYMGVASPSTDPGTPDQNVMYLCGAGTYPNFNNAVVDVGNLGVLKYNGSWTTQQVPLGYVDEILAFGAAIGGFFIQEGGVRKDTGGNISASTMLRTQFIEIPSYGNLRIAGYYGSTLNYAICAFYDANKQFLSAYQNPDLGNGFTIVNIPRTEVPENAKYIRCTTQKARIDESYVLCNNLYLLTLENNNILDEIEEIYQKFFVRNDALQYDSSQNGYINSSGGITSSGSSFKIYIYRVEPNSVYCVYNNLRSGSSRLYAVYSDTPSLSTLLEYGPFVSDERDTDYFWIKTGANAQYVVLQWYNGSEFALYDTRSVVMQDAYDKIDDLDKRLDAVEMASKKMCAELAANGEDLFVAWLDGSTEYTYWFKRCMANELYTFYRVGYRTVLRDYPDTAGISEGTGITLLNSTSSDNIGPIRFINGSWAGGNHTVSGDVKTAQTNQVKIIADNKPLSAPRQKMFCDKVVVRVTNTIYDPSETFPEGATILTIPISTETVNYVIDENSINVSVEERFEQTTNRIETYYGMQSMFVDETHILTPRGRYTNWREVSDTSNFSKASYPNFNRFIEKNAAGYQSTYLIPAKAGDHQYVLTSVFIAGSSNKFYHTVVFGDNAGLEVSEKTIVWSGSYTFFKDSITDNDDVFVYAGRLYGKDIIYVAVKRAFSGNLLLPLRYEFERISQVESDSSITFVGDFVDSSGLQIEATGAGSLIIIASASY